MSNTNKPVTIRILDKEYRIACDADERDALVASARHLDDRMQDIRRSGKVIGTDRIAVMAALNLTHELLTRPEQEDEADSVARRIQQLREHIEVALNDTNQLEL